MKNFIIIIAGLLMTTAVSAQSGKSIYQKYSDERGVDAVYISPAMFRMIGNLPITMDQEEVDIASIVKSLSGFYLLSAEDPAVSQRILSDVRKFVTNGHYELMMEAKGDGDKMTIYTVTEGDYITSLVMVATEPDETSFICLDGKILTGDFENMIAGLD